MLRIRVLTLNIWNREEPWEARLELMRQGIARLAPDIIGLQEDVQLGDRRLSDELKAGLGYESAFGAADELGPGLFLGNSVLSRFHIMSASVHPLPSVRTLERRSLLMTRLDTPAGVLPFCVTHLNWKPDEGYVREVQARSVIMHMDMEQRMNELPEILVGDFNAEPQSKEIQFLRNHLRDTYGCVGIHGGYTFDSFINPFALRTSNDRRRIDYIFVKAPCRPVSANVVLDKCVGRVCASDHFGVLAEIEV